MNWLTRWGTQVSENVTNELLLEQLKRIRGEQAAARDRDAELLRRLTMVETALANLLRDASQNQSDQIEDRHAVDILRQRLDRIERRLDLADATRTDV